MNNKLRQAEELSQKKQKEAFESIRIAQEQKGEISEMLAKTIKEKK